MAAQTHIYVYLDEFDTNEPVFMGVLHSEVIRGKEIFSYENDPGWLKHKRYRALDPDLTAFTGKQYFGVNKNRASDILKSIISTVAQWPQIATHYGISREEQHIVAHAFRTVK